MSNVTDLLQFRIKRIMADRDKAARHVRGPAVTDRCHVVDAFKGHQLAGVPSQSLLDACDVTAPDMPLMAALVDGQWRHLSYDEVGPAVARGWTVQTVRVVRSSKRGG